MLCIDPWQLVAVTLTSVENPESPIQSEPCSALPLVSAYPGMPRGWVDMMAWQAVDHWRSASVDR